LRIHGQQQNYVFQHLSTKDGLASDYVQSIFQDSKGFYWIGTTSGLQKYDGFTLTKSITVGNDLLHSSNVTQTRDGSIWISNENSLHRYNQTTGRFIGIAPEGNKAKMSLRVFEDSSGIYGCLTI
jgi:ligand-binding sensor domain-containing protein